ncbi:hypothetical protein K378_01997 [Streptomyces sp. Amel2xB2]|uniref:hypothetical protein n=1 Tax=Streptomyces sp. Amel2xB2 TaxID=1305829 RepID=UPI000DBFB036|nr:hypothetical protein [Streptomyces sp. Amel2xB2]RAJ69108.1 hypothetical protein K378_01997 [Streptomyces sp. Amel2xB2]
MGVVLLAGRIQGGAARVGIVTAILTAAREYGADIKPKVDLIRRVLEAAEEELLGTHR